MGKRCDGLQTSVDKLLEYHEKVPPSNPDDLDLMENVLNKFKVGRMNAILQQFNVERPVGVKREGKAILIVKNVPRSELLKLLEPPAEHLASTASTQSARSLNMDSATAPIGSEVASSSNASGCSSITNWYVSIVFQIGSSSE